jgi:hypothetical protein
MYTCTTYVVRTYHGTYVCVALHCTVHLYHRSAIGTYTCTHSSETENINRRAHLFLDLDTYSLTLWWRFPR